MMDGHYSGTGAHLKYKLNLVQDAAMQTFYVGSKYIYALQRSGYNDYLSRCELNTETGVYEQKDTMVLENFGHGQLLQYFTYGNNGYFWIGTYANQGKDQPFPWSQQIGRIKYAPGTTLNYKQVTRLTGLRYARKNKPALSNAVRVEGALSSDKTKFLVLVIDKSSPRRGHFVLYDNNKLNNVLDKVEGSADPAISCDNSEVIAAAVKDFVSNNVYSLSYDTSIEGLELADNDALYFSSSKGDKTRVGLSRMAWGASTSTHKLVDNSNWTSEETEGEAIQLSGSDVLIGITQYPNGQSGRRENSIYRFPKSAFD